MGKKHHSPTDNNSESDDETPLDNFFSYTEDSEILECFACLLSKECYFNLPDDLIFFFMLYINELFQLDSTRLREPASGSEEERKGAWCLECRVR